MYSAMYSHYLIRCVGCGANTSKHYARAHAGQCKACATGIDSERAYTCPDCGRPTLTAYQKASRYHCDQCTRDADPEGYRREVMGYNDGPDY